ncbi:MAG: GNAT family N-acetyltransferase [Bacteroidetes bacterium]|nr:GNAT family N-acetyltransferase [Bacteroidota bacterium]
MIQYAQENDLSAEEFIHVLQLSGLSERRPVNEPERIKAMLHHANLILTARIDGTLVGVSRAMTDFSFCTYLSDIAVDKKYQRQGIGIELIRLTKLASPLAKLILLAAPAAVGYYPKIGMNQWEHCYYLDDVSRLKTHH